MADTLAVDVKASLTWLFQDTLDLATVADASKLDYAKSFTDGTAVDLADKLWHDSRTLAASASEDLDLTNLTQSIFGSAVTISFAKVKALLIVNTSTTAGADLAVGGAGAAGKAWGAPFDGNQDAKILVPADSALLLVHKKDGWPVVNATTDVLRVANRPVASVTYKIAVVGTSS